MAPPYRYNLFGLRLSSELALPELHPDEGVELPDVLVEQGSIPQVYDPALELAVDKSGACLSIAGVARYLVSGGSRILVEPETGVPEPNIRLFLLGSAMGLLLHQRGLLPLHANAIEINGKAYAFMGRSGAGKSTLAAAFHDRGYRVIADDVCVIRFDDAGRAFACLGIPRLRLWEDALAATGRHDTAFERSYVGDDDYKKYDVPIFAKSGGESVPLAALYLLDRGNDLAITALQGFEVVDAIFANTYRGGLISSAGNIQTHWEACLRVVREVPIFSLVYPWGHDRLRDQIAEVLAHARSSIVPPRG